MAQREWSMEIGSGKLILLGLISGLTSEVEIAREAVDRHRPSAIGLTVTAEEIEGIKRWNQGNEELPPYTDFDLYYMKQMSRFGEVRLPSPSLAFLVEFAERAGIPLVPLDMGEEEYSSLYIQNVSPISLFFSSMFKSRRLRKKIQGSAEEVVCELDRLSMYPDGIAAVERERERHIASEIVSHIEENRAFLAAVNYEKAAKILKLLEDEKQ